MTKTTNASAAIIAAIPPKLIQSLLSFFTHYANLNYTILMEINERERVRFNTNKKASQLNY